MYMGAAEFLLSSCYQAVTCCHDRLPSKLKGNDYQVVFHNLLERDGNRLNLTCLQPFRNIFLVGEAFRDSSEGKKSLLISLPSLYLSEYKVFPSMVLRGCFPSISSKFQCSISFSYNTIPFLIITTVRPFI